MRTILQLGGMVLLVVGSISYLSGCNNQNNVPTTSSLVPQDIVPVDTTMYNKSAIIGKWQIKDVAQYTLSTSKREPIIVFHENGNVNGNTGCNNFSSTYTWKEKDILNIHQLTMTRKMCTGSRGQQEKAVIKALKQVVYVQIQGTTLLLLDQQQMMLIRGVKN